MAGGTGQNGRGATSATPNIALNSATLGPLLLLLLVLLLLLRLLRANLRSVADSLP